MDEIRQDIRYALRGLRQKPLFAMVAILSIAIGVGANATIFSVVNALLLRAPRGIGEPQRVVEVGRTSQGRGFDTFSYPELQSIATDVRSFDRVAGTRSAPMSYTGSSGAGERVMAMAVGSPYFDVMGTTPYKGRFFLAEEDAVANTSFVVVVSHAFWRKQMNSRADAVGATVELNRQPFTVIGIARPEFASHVPLVQTDLYIPLTTFGVARRDFNEFASWRSSWVTAVARLAPGVTVDGASRELASHFDKLRGQRPDIYGARSDGQRSARAAQLTGVPAAGHGPITAFLSLLMGLVALVLLTTCANVAGMLIARAAGREREIAIRLALGSGRSRLVRQLVIESVALFVIGGALGVLLSTWGLRAIASLTLPVPVTLHLDFSPDTRVFAFGLVLALATGLVFGLAPALQATQPNLVSSLKNEGSAAHSRGGRLRRIFVVAQVSFSLVLLISAGLFLRSLQRAASVDVGFRPEGVQTMRFNLALDGYDDARGREFMRTLTNNLAGAPGVTAAALATDLPLDMGISETSTWREGMTDDDQIIQASFNQITPGYFDALSIRIEQGRAFRESDVATGQRVAVVSHTYAERTWPGESAIGKRIHWGDRESDAKTIIGVVSDVKNKMVTDGPDPMVYVPQSQEYSSGVTLLVKTPLRGREAETAIRRHIQAIDPNLSVTPVQSLEGMTSIGTLPQRIAAVISASLGVLALVLSGMGIYGVIAYMVTQRTREIGVRMAIGARRADVINLVLRSGMRLALPGIAIGAAAALALGRLMRSFILDVAPVDPITFTTVPVLLLLMIGVATCVPAMRAARVSPMTALRSE